MATDRLRPGVAWLLIGIAGFVSWAGIGALIGLIWWGARVWGEPHA